jgi:hypothetical protein
MAKNAAAVAGGCAIIFDNAVHDIHGAGALVQNSDWLGSGYASA